MTLDFFIEICKAACFSFGAIVSFSVIFNSTLKNCCFGALAGAIGWVVYFIIKNRFGSETAGYAASAFATTAFSELFAILFKAPATVFLVPGIFPIVPGGGIYKTMFFIVTGDVEQAASVGHSTLIAAGAIALGIAIASSFFRVITRYIKNHSLKNIN